MRKPQEDANRQLRNNKHHTRNTSLWVKHYNEVLPGTGWLENTGRSSAV